MREDLLVWVDIETTGLDPISDSILEIGFVITDTFGEFYAQKNWLVRIETVATLRNHSSPFVREMHDKSKLWLDLESEKVYDFETASNEVIDFLCGELRIVEFTDKIFGPMCGSSVHFDRSFLKAQMPTLESGFTHRNIDNSSLKEICRRVNPQVYSGLSEAKGVHRVLPDLEDTIGEYQFYLDNFLFVAPVAE